MTIIEPKTEIIECLTDSIIKLSKETRLLYSSDCHVPDHVEKIELTIEKLCITLQEQTKTTIITPRITEEV